MSTTDLKQFEQQLARLEAIVNELENDDLSLEESLSRFEEGVKLSKQCQLNLAQAEQRVNKLCSDSDQNLPANE